MGKLSVKQAVILAGGAGTRLRPFTLTSPKPLFPVNGQPFLEHLLKLVKNNGIKEVLLLTGYLGEKIKNYFGDGNGLGLSIRYSHIPFTNKNGEEIKSGLRLKNAEKLLHDHFLLMYCDNYWPLQLNQLLSYYQDHDSDALVTVYTNSSINSNNILVDSNGYVAKYDKHRQDPNLNGKDIGFFILNKKVIQFLPSANSQFETVVLPELIKNRRLCGFVTYHHYYSIGDLERAKITEKFLVSKKVVFLDRDGVINKKPPQADYVKNWKEFMFLPGSVEAIKIMTEQGYKIIIISNQAGIARKKMTEKDLLLIHSNMLKALQSSGGHIDGIYYCPHGWDEGCDCRKPKPGMFFKASQEHLIDLTKSIFIGDDERDIEAGKAAGCKTILLNQGKNLLQITKEITN